MGFNDPEFEQLRTLRRPLILYVGDELTRAAGMATPRDAIDDLLVKARRGLSPEQLDELMDLAQQPDPGEAFYELERVLGKAEFGRIVERRLNDSDARPTALASALADLRERLHGVITPCLGHLLEDLFQPRLRVVLRPPADLASRSGWLYKMCGTLEDHSTWVLTREQQERAIYHDTMGQDLFRGLFLSHPILFVATRLDDPVLRAVTDRIRALAKGQPPRHWALVPEREASPSRSRKLSAAGISLIPYADEDGGHEGCVPLLRALAPTQSEAPSRPTPARRRDPLSILFVAANPRSTDPLRLDSELRAIRNAIERSKHRDQLALEIRMAATVHDLRRALLEHDYDVVHISGHGEEKGLLLEDEQGECVQVREQALARLLSAYAAPEGSLRCVVLNACHSLSTGQPTGATVPFTIAMDGPIADAGALEFSRGFYDALGAGRDFTFAYEEGCRSVELAAHGATFKPSLIRA